MPKIELTPTIEHLAQEYLLVPAWKKSHDYIRHQNWYSDVPELDLTNTNLADVMWSLAQEISSDNPIVPTPLRLVLAPKSRPWEIANDQWRPVGGPSSVSCKLRPLALRRPFRLDVRVRASSRHPPSSSGTPSGDGHNGEQRLTHPPSIPDRRGTSLCR